MASAITKKQTTITLLVNPMSRRSVCTEFGKRGTCHDTRAALHLSQRPSSGSLHGHALHAAKRRAGESLKLSGPEQ